MGISETAGVRVGFDRDFLDAWLRRQKYAWTIIAIVIAAGLTGVLGRGPIAYRTVSSGPEGLVVKYEKIARNKTPAVIQVRLPSGLSSDAPVRLRVEGDSAQGGRLKQITPQPVHSVMVPEGFIAEFPPAEGAGQIALIQEPGMPGLLRTRISVENGPSVNFTQVVLP